MWQQAIFPPVANHGTANKNPLRLQLHFSSKLTPVKWLTGHLQPFNFAHNIYFLCLCHSFYILRTENTHKEWGGKSLTISYMHTQITCILCPASFWLADANWFKMGVKEAWWEMCRPTPNQNSFFPIQMRESICSPVLLIHQCFTRTAYRNKQEVPAMTVDMISSAGAAVSLTNGHVTVLECFSHHFNTSLLQAEQRLPVEEHGTKPNLSRTQQGAWWEKKFEQFCSKPAGSVVGALSLLQVGE